MSEQGSITHWIRDLENGDAGAAQQLWERYCKRLTGFARKQLPAHERRVTDEEDIALSAFAAFLNNMEEGAYDTLGSRDDLRRILLAITRNKVLDLQKYNRREKRGDGIVRGESAFDEGSDASAGHGIENVEANQSTPSMATIAADELDRLLQCLPPDPAFREIVLFKLDGCTNLEVAKELGKSERTIERKLNIIRTAWSSRDG